MRPKTKSDVEKRWVIPMVWPMKVVYADDGSSHNDNDPSGDGDEGEKTPQVSFEDLIAKARKEEKDKLYKQMDALKNKVETLTKSNNEHLLTISELQSKIDDLTVKLTTAGKGDPQEVIDLKTKLSDALKDLAALKKQVDEFESVDEATLRETIEAEISARYEVKLYRLQKLQEAGEDILVPELVMGNTKEEIDSSFAAAKTRSDELREKLGNKKPEQKQTPRKPANPNNPPDKGNVGKDFDFDYVAGLDPSSDEYKEWRKKLGIK